MTAKDMRKLTALRRISLSGRRPSMKVPKADKAELTTKVARSRNPISAIMPKEKKYSLMAPMMPLSDLGFTSQISFNESFS